MCIRRESSLDLQELQHFDMARLGFNILTFTTTTTTITIMPHHCPSPPPPPPTLQTNFSLLWTALKQ
jgi:hypothetical protein